MVILETSLNILLNRNLISVHKTQAVVKQSSQNSKAEVIRRKRWYSSKPSHV